VRTGGAMAPETVIESAVRASALRSELMMFRATNIRFPSRERKRTSRAAREWELSAESGS